MPASPTRQLEAMRDSACTDCRDPSLSRSLDQEENASPSSMVHRRIRAKVWELVVSYAEKTAKVLSLLPLSCRFRRSSDILIWIQTPEQSPHALLRASVLSQSYERKSPRSHDQHLRWVLHTACDVLLYGVRACPSQAASSPEGTKVYHTMFGPSNRIPFHSFAFFLIVSSYERLEEPWDPQKRNDYRHPGKCSPCSLIRFRVMSHHHPFCRSGSWFVHMILRVPSAFRVRPRRRL